MGKPLKDLTGKRFGSLVVITLGVKQRKMNGAWWLCKCDCGNEKSIPATDMVMGKVSSCGCEHSKRIGKANETHGMSKTRTYRIWRNMITRCQKHMDYAGRGISIDPSWMRFESFLSDMGEAPDGMSIDRIDCNGNYESSNCRWATNEEQMNNTRKTVFIEWNGKRQSLTDWCKELGIGRGTLRSRLFQYNWPLEKAMTTQVNPCR